MVWLAISVALLAASLAAVVVVALPVMLELSRAARSAERLFETLARELPPTLEALRLTGQELAELSDHVDEGVRSASQVVQQVDAGVESLRQGVHQTQSFSRQVWVGAKAAWRVLRRPSPAKGRQRLKR